jgi:hypothetical protein
LAESPALRLPHSPIKTEATRAGAIMAKVSSWADRVNESMRDSKVRRVFFLGRG